MHAPKHKYQTYQMSNFRKEQTSDSLNYLPSFLVNDLDTSNEEEENETIDNEDINTKLQYNLNRGQHIHPYLNPPHNNKYQSFDDISQYKMAYQQMNPYNLMLMQPQPQLQHQNQISNGLGQGNNFFPQQNNFVFNSFNFIPHQLMPTKKKEKVVLGKPKSKTGSMRNIDITSSLFNAFQQENLFAEKIRLQSHASAFMNPQSVKIKQKKRKKSHKTNSNSDKSQQLLSMPSFLSFPDNELYSYIITQKGSREVQSILKKANDKDVESLLKKLSSNFADIMMNKYGNYFSQKLIQICSLSQRITLLEIIRPHFTKISCNSFGTHPLQSLIEIINLPKEREILVKSIESKEIELSLDANGTHVIQKLISCTTNKEREEINKNILNHIGELITDSFGVCVLIKLINHSTTMALKEQIANYISTNDPLFFIQDPYSNYVVQSLFNKTDIVLCKNIIIVIRDNFYCLSMQKYSSNVVENCIRYSDESVVHQIYNDAIKNDKVIPMLKNTYGGFVIEKLVARLNKEQRAEIVKEVQKLGKEITLSNTLLVLLYK